MAKLLTAVSSAIFLWTFWSVSGLGVYVGTYTSKADGQLQCRYATVHGFLDAPQAETAMVRGLNSKWCPTTRFASRDPNARVKPVHIHTASEQ